MPSQCYSKLCLANAIPNYAWPMLSQTMPGQFFPKLCLANYIPNYTWPMLYQTMHDQCYLELCLVNAIPNYAWLMPSQTMPCQCYPKLCSSQSTNFTTKTLLTQITILPLLNSHHIACTTNPPHSLRNPPTRDSIKTASWEEERLFQTK